MKLSTLTFAALSLLALSACNTQPAENTADNAVNAAVADNAAVTDNGSTTGEDGKPVDGTGNEATAPAGDKPEATGNESASDEAVGDKPTE